MNQFHLTQSVEILPCSSVTDIELRTLEREKDAIVQQNKSWQECCFARIGRIRPHDPTAGVRRYIPFWV